MGRIADQKKKEWEGFKIKTQFLIKDDKKESVNRKRQWLTHFFSLGFYLQTYIKIAILTSSTILEYIKTKECNTYKMITIRTRFFNDPRMTLGS